MYTHELGGLHNCRARFWRVQSVTVVQVSTMKNTNAHICSLIRGSIYTHFFCSKHSFFFYFFLSLYRSLYLPRLQRAQYSLKAFLSRSDYSRISHAMSFPLHTLRIKLNTSNLYVFFNFMAIKRLKN